MSRDEEQMPCISDEERWLVLAEHTGKKPWAVLYAGASEQARRRIDIACLYNAFVGKRNLYPLREERCRVERLLDEGDLVYLSRGWPVAQGREYFQQLLFQLRARTLRTDERLEEMLATYSDEDAEIVRRTLQAAESLEDPVIVTTDLVWTALGGGIDAQALLGDCFLHEHEVIRDTDIAAFWLRKAAPYDEASKKLLQQLADEGLAQ